MAIAIEIEKRELGADLVWVFVLVLGGGDEDGAWG
jgi:hypothetical protein